MIGVSYVLFDSGLDRSFSFPNVGFPTRERDLVDTLGQEWALSNFNASKEFFDGIVGFKDKF